MKNQMCTGCKERGHDWPGSPPKCAFLSGVFSDDNWNCATMNKLRSLNPYLERNGDQVGFLLHVMTDSEEAFFVYVTHYKERGRVESAFLMRHTPTPLPLEVAEAILEEHGV